MRACSRNSAINDGATRLALPPRAGAEGLTRARPPMTRRSPTGSRARSAQTRADVARLRRQARQRVALRREPASERRLLRRARDRAPASRPRASSRARSSPTTTSTTPTRPIELVAEFEPEASAAVGDHQARQPVRRRGRRDPAGSLREGAAVRSGLGLRRRRRAQPPARRGGGAQDRRDLHRGDHRAGGRRRGVGDRRDQEEPAPADRRRAARSARADR